MSSLAVLSQLARNSFEARKSSFLMLPRLCVSLIPVLLNYNHSLLEMLMPASMIHNASDLMALPMMLMLHSADHLTIRGAACTRLEASGVATSGACASVSLSMCVCVCVRACARVTCLSLSLSLFLCFWKVYEQV